MKILVLDNYDSFTYNIVHYVKELTSEQVDVFRNDEIDINSVGNYDKILLSPGPGIPSEAGIMPEVIKKYSDSKNIFGVCLGHQAIVEAFGGKIMNLDTVYHGVETEMTVLDEEEILFNGITKKFKAGRYHSWNAVTEDLPACFNITCTDDKGLIMGVRHKTLNVRGVQFHPESVLTPEGKKMIDNWINAL